MATRPALLVLAASLALSSAGCIKSMLLNGQLEATRKAAAAVDTISDYEVAQSAAFAGLAQFEGLHYLAPDNEDGLFLLTKGWAGASFAFIEDMMEQAEDAEGDQSPLFQYYQARARSGYERAFHYGVELLEKKKGGFAEARKNDQSLKAWLKDFDDAEHDVPILFWTGNAWMSKTNVIKEDPAAVAELFVGVAMMERAVQLDDTYNNGAGHIALGAYHARSPMAELEEGKKELEKAVAMTQGKFLMAKFQLAAKYYCVKGDKDAYVKTLTEVAQAGDIMPDQRLANTIARRRAKRYLAKPRMRACGF